MSFFNSLKENHRPWTAEELASAREVVQRLLAHMRDVGASPSEIFAAAKVGYWLTAELAKAAPECMLSEWQAARCT